MQASEDAATGGEQGSGIAQALEDCTPQQVREGQQGCGSEATKLGRADPVLLWLCGSSGA
jgi:hypothetical protein